tara:strand:+ start:14132 stop:14575 length:444 start_codon:yes stop_codon:yes gene_type:complete
MDNYNKKINSLTEAASKITSGDSAHQQPLVDGEEAKKFVDSMNLNEEQTAQLNEAAMSLSEKNERESTPVRKRSSSPLETATGDDLGLAMNRSMGMPRMGMGMGGKKMGMAMPKMDSMGMGGKKMGTGKMEMDLASMLQQAMQSMKK